MSQGGEVAGYQGQQAQYADQIAQLGTASQQAGIPIEQGREQLAYGLNQLGVSTDPTQDVLQGLTGETGAAQGIQQLYQAASAVGRAANWLNDYFNAG